MTRSTTRLTGATVVLADITARLDITVEGGRIVAIDPATGADGTGGAGGADDVIDVRDRRVVAGFVDLQVNGGIGIDLAAEPEQMWRLAERLPEWGVTSFLPTIITSPPGTVERARAALAEPPPDYSGATPLGLHLEGPMLNPAMVGAHRPDLLRPPSLDLIDDWSRADGVAMVTLAPEMPGALDVVRALCDREIVVAIGHSDASHDEVVAAIEAGTTHVTHLYNAMSSLHHRAPGVVGTTLARDDVTASIIVDGVHVHPAAVRVAWKARGPADLALVSDAAPGRGMPPGMYGTGDSAVTVGEAGIRTTDGILAGSDLTSDAAVRNLIEFTGCSWDEAVRAASAVPARVGGFGAKGEIAVGRDADLVVLDNDLEVVLTMIGGRVVHDPGRLAPRPTSSPPAGPT